MKKRKRKQRKKKEKKAKARCCYDHKKGTYDGNRKKATDIKENPAIKLPGPLKLKKSQKLQ